MRRLKSRRQGFTLAELIMAVALLAFFSVFIVQLFAKADQVSKRARNLDQAVACASNFADQWRMSVDEGVPAEILDLRQNRAADKTAIISLDSHFEICLPEQAYYQAALTLVPDTETANLWQLEIVIGRVKPTDSAPVYTLKTSRYFAGEVSGS